MTPKEQAVKGAGERLARLEDGIRKLFYVVVATAVMASITTSISLLGAYRYWQVTTALSHYGDYAKKTMDDPEVKASQASLKVVSDRLKATIDRP